MKKVFVLILCLVVVSGCIKMEDGEHKSYYKDGSVKAVYTFKNGKLHGTAKTFYQSGQQRTESHYNYGKLDGEAKKWTRTGKLAGLAVYKAGNKVSEKQYDVVQVG